MPARKGMQLNEPTPDGGEPSPYRFCDLPYFVALGAVLWLGFFPGIMNADSTDMLKQAVFHFSWSNRRIHL